MITAAQISDCRIEVVRIAGDNNNETPTKFPFANIYSEFIFAE